MLTGFGEDLSVAQALIACDHEEESQMCSLGYSYFNKMQRDVWIPAITQWHDPKVTACILNEHNIWP